MTFIFITKQTAVEKNVIVFCQRFIKKNIVCVLLTIFKNIPALCKNIDLIINRIVH